MAILKTARNIEKNIAFNIQVFIGKKMNITAEEAKIDAYNGNLRLQSGKKTFANGKRK
jgi:hypothetical protein